MTFIAYKLGRVALGMLGKFAASLYFNAFYIWSAELNATVVRYVYVFFLLKFVSFRYKKNFVLESE